MNNRKLSLSMLVATVVCVCSINVDSFGAETTGAVTILDTELPSGLVSDFAASDSLLFVCVGLGIDVLSIADPSQPNRLSRIFELGRNTLNISVFDTLLVLGTRSDSIHLYSVADPANPRYLYGFNCTCDRPIVELRDNQLYILSLDRLIVYDISPLSGPDSIFTDRLSTWYPTADMCLYGDSLWIANNDLFVSDIGNPWEPVIDQQVNVPYTANDVVFDDSMVAVAAQMDLYPTPFSALVLYERRPDSGLSLVSSDTIIGRCNYLDMLGDKVYLSCGKSGFQVWDISEPSAPVLTECVDVEDVAGPVIVTDDSIVVMAGDFRDWYEPRYNVCTGDKALSIHNDSFPNPDVIPAGGLVLYRQTDSTLEKVGRYPGGGDLLNLSYDGGGIVAIADAANRVHFFDVGETELGAGWDLYLPGTNVEDVALFDQAVVVGTQDSGLIVYSMDSIGSQRLSQTTPTASLYQMDAYEDIVVAANWTTTSLYDFSSRDTLTEFCRINALADPAVDAAYDGRYVYVAERYAGLRVWDVIDPANPTEVYRIEGWITEVDVDGSYMVTAGDRLRVWDISNRTVPLLQAQIVSPALGNFWSVELYNGVLGVAQADGGFHLYDITEPGNAVLLSTMPAPSWVIDVALWDDKLLALDMSLLLYFQLDVSTGIVDEPSDRLSPDSPFLVHTYPNPFNDALQVQLTVASRLEVTVEVINVLGQVVDNLYTGELTAGEHRFEWHAEASSGVYFVRVTGDDAVVSRKVMYLK